MRRSAPALTVVSSGLRVRLIAIDGFDPRIARRLAEARPVPGARRAARRRARGHRRLTTPAIRRAPGRRSPRASRRRCTPCMGSRRGGSPAFRAASRPGSEPASARALGAVTDLLRLTTPSIASGSERRVKTFWEVATAAGLRTAVVNWWATWPAPPKRPDRHRSRDAAARARRELDAEIAPADALRRRSRAAGRRCARGVGARGATCRDGTEMDALLRRSAELDALQTGAHPRRSRAANADLRLHLPARPRSRAARAVRRADGRRRASPSAVAARLASLDEYYVLLDALLAPRCSVAGDDC